MALHRRLASAVAFLILAIAAQAGDFIRVDEDDSAARLQTAITRFEKKGTFVELIGAVHIADKAYYETLTTRFASYDALLFEMIGGEKYAAQEKPAADPALKEKDVSGLHQIYGMISRYLDLAGQTDCIDYATKNFVHADLTNAEFNQMQKERGESILGFAMKAAKSDTKETAQPDTSGLIKAMISGRPNLVKLEIIHTLGQGDDQIAALAGRSVIITDRNQRCLDVMNRELAAGHKKLGIFYGAAHFPDMEKHLLEQGFQRTQQEWLTAWDIPKAVALP